MMNLNTKVTSKRVVSAFVIGAIFVGLNATGALGGFWRTLDNLTTNGVTAPTSYDYGYGYGDYGWGYGYGYGYGMNYGYGSSLDTTLASAKSVVGSTTASVSMQTGTEIKTSTNVSFSDIVSANQTVPGSLEAVEVYPRDVNLTRINTKLLFSKPMLVDFGTTTSLTVTVKHYGDSSYNLSGLTLSSGATCTNGVASAPYTGTTITDGKIYTCSASSFVATTATTATSSSSSSSSSGGGGSSTSTCLDSQLICKEVSGAYKLFRKSGVSCVNGNLGKTCEIIDNGTWTTDDSSDNTDSSDTNTSGFTDINNSFAKDYINKLKDLGVVNGRDAEGKIFAPKSNTTRSEFLKMTLKLFGKDYSTTDVSKLTFSDVSKTSWQAKVVAKAVSEGIISTANSKFRPNDSISRAEAVKILLKVAGIKASEVSTSSFSDVSGWATKYVEQAKKSGIVNGQTVNGKLMFRPSDSITREEVAKVIVKTNDL